MMRQALRRAMACFLLAAVLSTAAVIPASAAGFRDVPSGHWAAESIERCVSLGFFQGKSASQFGMGEEMTRSAFAVVLCRFFGWETPVPDQATFQDVPVNAWYAGAVEAAYDHGAVTDQRKDFRPNDPITREELAVMLVRALGYGNIAGLVQELPTPFQDVTSSAGYITMAHDMGLMDGTSGTVFAPDQTASREQVAVILMRLYDQLHSSEPETLAMLSASEYGEMADMTGLNVVVVPAGRLIGAGGRPMITGSIQAEAAGQMLDAAHQAGAKALLSLDGGPSALDADIQETAKMLAQTVKESGYDGLFLDIPQLKGEKKRDMTQLTKALAAELGELSLYLVAEAPTWAGKAYDGYDYEELARAADHLVLRVGSYESHDDGFSTAPVSPLEEVYYALALLQDGIDTSKLTLLLDTAPSVWDSSGRQRTLSAEELGELMASGEQHYSTRYACAYLTGSGQDGSELVAWYLDQEAIQTRKNLAQAFDVGQLCLTDWNAVVKELFADSE